MRHHLYKTITSHDMNGKIILSYNVKNAFLHSCIFYSLVFSRGFWNSPVIIITVIVIKNPNHLLMAVENIYRC